MVEIDLDGKKVSVAEGSMVMHAAEAAGTYIPHFCYHKKLSIAANCRMCLVDIEKAPKPMPACATPVTQGMIVRTKSDKALKAQQSVMEFLLINHPLDCPICDQGGECQLQDLAVGYGGSASRYQEEKRVVLAKDVGPIISMEEMSRCIHCTRCVRFGQEVAGVMELGMVHRGEHSEITTIATETIDSELSGNMIDICPVGALTSKPFRYSARTWELSRRKSVSPHDSVGANLIVQVKSHQVMRVVPLENEAVNECWIADRDRFSYEAFNGPERLTAPMIKQGGEWKTVDWTTALEYVARNLQQVREQHGARAIGFLGHGTSTNEELYLLGKLGREFADGNVDHRLRHADPKNQAQGRFGARWLGLPVAGLSDLQRAWVIGAFLRKDQPLFAQRLRQATKKGGQVLALNASHDDWLMPVAQQWSLPPDHWVDALAEVAVAVARAAELQPPPGELLLGRANVVSADAERVAKALLSGERKAILLGNAAVQHPQASALQALADWIGQATGASVGCFGDAGNSVGAQAVGAVPEAGALTVREMLQGTLKAVVLLNVEPALDLGAGSAALRGLGKAHTVIALTPFKTTADVDADVLLPITPFTETAGSFVNAEGRLQTFHGVVKPQADARPGWKVLRVLGSMLGLPGFEFNSSEEVLKEAFPAGQASVTERLDNTRPAALVQTYVVPAGPGPASGALAAQRVSHVPIYSTDAAVRRSPALQATADARHVVAHIGAQAWRELGMQPGDRVEVTGDDGVAVLPAMLDPTLAAGVVRVPAGHKSTATVGAMFGRVRLTRVPASVVASVAATAGAGA